MKPHNVSKLEMAFAAHVSHLMPPYESIPDEFKNGRTKQNEIVARWFFSGLPGGTKFVPKEGIDAAAALNHIKTILRSYEPKHEHKEAACAYLLDQWFEDVVIPTPLRNGEV